MKRLSVGVVAISLIQTSGSVVAQNIGPVSPDVVMECFQSNRPAASCQFSCGTELASPPAGKEVIWPNVDRVEIHNKGNTGRTDTRSWVFVRFKASPMSPAASFGLYIGPRYYCSATLGEAGSAIELRITK